MGVEFFSPSGKAIRLVVFSKKEIGSQDSRQGEDDKKMYVSELRNPHPSVNIIGAITSRGPGLETHEHFSHNPSLKRIT